MYADLVTAFALMSISTFGSIAATIIPHVSLVVVAYTAIQKIRQKARWWHTTCAVLAVAAAIILEITRTVVYVQPCINRLKSIEGNTLTDQQMDQLGFEIMRQVAELNVLSITMSLGTYMQVTLATLLTASVAGWLLSRISLTTKGPNVTQWLRQALANLAKGRSQQDTTRVRTRRNLRDQSTTNEVSPHHGQL